MVRRGSNTIRDRWNTVRLVESLFVLASPRSPLASRLVADLQQSLTVVWESTTALQVTGRSPIITKLALAQLVNLAGKISGRGGLELPPNSRLDRAEQWKGVIQNTFDRLTELGLFQEQSSQTEKFNGFRTFILQFPADPTTDERKLTWLRQALGLTDPIPSPQIARHNLPEVDLFVGRSEELTKIHQLIQPGKIAAITGMRGVGKSTLAKQYAWENLAEYPGGICWIEPHANIAHAVLNFQGLPLEPSAGNAIAQLNECWKNWQFSGRILLILDDFNDRQILQRYLGQALKMPQINILLTSWQMSGQGMNEIRLDCLAKIEAEQLLHQYISDRDADPLDAQTYCQQICSIVGNSPFAIEKLGYYLSCDPDLSLSVLLQQLQRNKLAYPALAEISIALELVWERLSYSAQMLGCLMSLFAPVSINWQLLERFTQLLGLGDLVTAARPELLRYHTIERLGKDRYRLHELMREFLQTKLTSSNWNRPELERCHQIFAHFLVKLAVKIPEGLNDITLPFWQDIIPHLTEAVQTSSSIETLSSSELELLLSGLERYHKSRGNYDLALRWCDRRQQLIFENNDRESMANFDCLNDKAVLHLWQQQYLAAQAALTAAQNLLLLQEPQNRQFKDMILAINWGAFYYNLGNHEKSERRYQEALLFYNKALEISKTKSEWYSYQISIFNNLGVLYHEAGSFQDLDRAKQYYLEALEIADKIELDPNHPDRGRCLQSLAKIYRSEGDYHQALTILSQCLPSDHPELARSKYNLAYFYWTQCRYAECEKLLTQALTVLERKLGNNHPWTQEARSLAQSIKIDYSNPK